MTSLALTGAGNINNILRIFQNHSVIQSNPSPIGAFNPQNPRGFFIIKYNPTKNEKEHL